MKLTHSVSNLGHSEHQCIWSQAKFETDVAKMQAGQIEEESLDTFLEKVIQVNSVALKHEAAQPFAGTSIVIIHHLTRECLGTIQALRKLGCKDISCQFLGYNADAAKAFGPFLAEVPDTELKLYKLAENKDGSYSVDRAFTKPSNALPADALDEAMRGQDYLTCQRSLASFVSMEVLARCETSEQPMNMIVIEDGGYMAPLLNDSALRKQSVASFRKENSVAEDGPTDSKLASYSDMGEIVGKHLVGTVEHTRNGYDKVQKVYLEQHGNKLARPCFTIALYYVKTQFEAVSGFPLFQHNKSRMKSTKDLFHTTTQHLRFQVLRIDTIFAITLGLLVLNFSADWCLTLKLPTSFSRIGLEMLNLIVFGFLERWVILYVMHCMEEGSFDDAFMKIIGMSTRRALPLSKRIRDEDFRRAQSQPWLHNKIALVLTVSVLLPLDLATDGFFGRPLTSGTFPSIVSVCTAIHQSNWVNVEFPIMKFCKDFLMGLFFIDIILGTAHMLSHKGPLKKALYKYHAEHHSRHHNYSSVKYIGNPFDLEVFLTQVCFALLYKQRF